MVGGGTPVLKFMANLIGIAPKRRKPAAKKKPAKKAPGKKPEKKTARKKR